MYKLLIIDDEEHTIKALKSIIDFEKYGITTIFQAASGEEGLQIIVRKTPDIIMTDMNMPHMNGVELIRQCHELSIEAQIIVLSGYDDFKYTKNAIKYKVLDYILKPVEFTEVDSTMKKAVENIKNGISTNSRRMVTTHSAVEYRIKDYIDEKYSSTISLDILSNDFFLSKESITRHFKARFDMGVYEYVIKLRMKKSKELLLNTDHNISEISEMVGFYDSNYFSKAFRKYFNMSPSRMRHENSE